MSNETYYHLSDKSIGQIAKLVQIAILTGTDVVDHLRLIKLVSDDKGELSPTSEYEKGFEDQISKMMEENPLNSVSLVDKTDDSDSITGNLLNLESNNE